MIESARLLKPEIILAGAALALLALDVSVGRGSLKRWALAAALASLAAALACLLRFPDSGRAFGMLSIDEFSHFFKLVSVLGAGLVLLLAEDDDSLMGGSAGTFAGLVLLSTVGTMLLASAEDFLILFVALELTTIPLFILAGFLRRDLRSNEGAIKFFLMGAFSTGLMLYGISFLYGSAGSTHFQALASVWSADVPANRTLDLVGLFFLLAGLGFKLTLVPFHQWVPDAYEGAPTPITAFFAVSRDAGVIVVMLRLFGEFVPIGRAGLTDLFALLSVLTMTIGNLTALRQESLKRLLAYSSIAHAGTLFIGLVAANPLGREGVMVYALAYTLMGIGAFAVVAAVARIKGSDSLEAIEGLAGEHFGLAMLMLIFLLSLSGIPPFLGFLGKFYVFAAAIEAGLGWLVAIGLLNSVISVYYYFRIVHKMFFRDSRILSLASPANWSLRIAAGASAAALLIFGVFPHRIASWVGQASRALQ
ncbi:MAG: hypothetical protein A2902_07695 [Elusimicrobia bacterium RIFCSPLOWO2_01_FULL_64_13]|nr:MAG: hypothetical protein A2902_07695 [Elusimicrobia bacterium RIFCSPLOWO2_01_FULL_64_13]